MCVLCVVCVCVCVCVVYVCVCMCVCVPVVWQNWVRYSRGRWGKEGHRSPAEERMRVGALSGRENLHEDMYATKEKENYEMSSSATLALALGAT